MYYTWNGWLVIILKFYWTEFTKPEPAHIHRQNGYSSTQITT